MNKFSKLSTMVLAGALSIAFVFPIKTLAYNDQAPRSFTGKYNIRNFAQLIENKDAQGRVISYTDLGTGKTDEKKKNLYDESTPREIRIPVKEYVDLKITLKDGQYRISDVKSHNKKALHARLRKTEYEISKSTKPVEPNESYGKYHIRLYATKAGTSKISYKVYDYNENKVKTVTVKVAAKDVDPFKSITFGGKSLLYDNTIGAKNSDYIYQGRNKFTYKKSGKIKIKMNTDFRLIRVITAVNNNYEYRKSSASVEPYHSSSAVQIAGPETTDNNYIRQLGYNRYKTYTDWGKSTTFKLKLSTVPDYYISRSYGNSEEQYKNTTYSHEKTTMSSSVYSTTTLYVIFEDAYTNKLYCFEADIRKLLE